MSAPSASPHFAQDKLGDLVHVEQPKVGRKLAAKEDAQSSNRSRRLPK